MIAQSPLVSVLIVNFHSDEKVRSLRESLNGSAIPFECIVEDNSTHNKGFGCATNSASKRARGKYLFICNPDVVASKTTLEELLIASRRLKNRAAIAPQLRNEAGIPYLSTTKRLGWLQLVVAHSILNKIWRNNPVSKNFWGDTLPLSESRFVENASGAALFMPKFMFDSLGGFDEQFFLYFEDNDLCNRLSDSGFRIWYAANVQIIHEQHGATTDMQQAINFFHRSRWIYSKKTFGLLPALISEAWLRLWELAKP